MAAQGDMRSLAEQAAFREKLFSCPCHNSTDVSYKLMTAMGLSPLTNYFGENMSRKPIHTLLNLVAALMATIPAKAQEADKLKINFGVQASVSIPQTKIDYNKGGFGITTGYGASAFVELAWSNNWGVRGQIEHLSFNKYKDEYSNDSKSSHNMAIVDCMYHTKAKYLSYLFVGFGISEAKMTNSEGRGPHTGGCIFYGAGWNLTTNFGVEIKHALDNYNRFQASALLRF